MNSIADIAAAPAAMPDHELHALRATIDGEPVIVPGRLAWPKSAALWRSRSGMHRSATSNASPTSST